MIEQGDVIRLPGDERFVKVRGVNVGGPPYLVFLEGDTQSDIRQVTLTPDQVEEVEWLTADGTARSEEVLAAMWSEWMRASATTATGAALVSSELTPYPHQYQAVYQRMLPQPMLRFLLGDEPGTGKTIMGGLYARESQRLGIIKRCLVVCPAHLVTKWQADFDRWLGGGLRRIDNNTVKQHALRDGLAQGDGFWVVSLELAAKNSAVLEAIHPDVSSWDLVIFDEAHRLTPTAEQLHQVGRLLAKNAPRVLLMTATPHRGNEWLFRSLMHLVDHEVFPDVEPKTEYEHRLVPGPMHFLRRMKEELYEHDNQTRLFHDRIAENIRVPLSATEFPFYQHALDMVDAYFPKEAKTLARMVYGKRAASALYSLRETLRRRLEHMGTLSDPEAIRDVEFGDPYDDDPAAAEHAVVIAQRSQSEVEEKRAIRSLLDQIDKHLEDPTHSGPEDRSSKWPKMVQRCLSPHRVSPGGGIQLVVFTEYADTADWLVREFRTAGFTAERYSGRDSFPDRDEIRDRFMAKEFEVIVSTDAGNEGIDLQSAHVLINWDIPWSLVTLEQRMGRIHRVGQDRDVYLFNLIATGTLEGDTYAKLLDRLVLAANEMGGKMFDCLSLVAEQVFGGKNVVPLAGLFEGDPARVQAEAAVEAITAERLRQAAEDEIARERALATEVDLKSALDALQEDQLEKVNPHIVDRYMLRVQSAGLLKVKASTLATAGLFNVNGTASFRLPQPLSFANPPTLVATSSEAKSEAVRSGAVGASRAIDLNPSTEAFRALVDATGEHLRPALYRGAVVQDETTATDYTLFLFEAPASEGLRRMTWRQLVKVDPAGARRVRFDILNNMVPFEGPSAGGYHPGEHHQAHAEAVTAISDRKARREQVLNEWHAAASKQLRRLPADLVKDVQDQSDRRKLRDNAKQAVEVRSKALRAASDLHVQDPELIGWARVLGRGKPEAPTEKNSEEIAMDHVIRLLRGANYEVADVSQERIGYDVRARRHFRHRLIEVKGIWESASATGIRLTGDEMIRAGIHGDDYWLYVVDQCLNGEGVLRAVVKNPAKVFDGLARDVPILAIKGSDLMAAPFDDPV